VGKHIFSPLFRFSGRTFLPLQILRIFFLIFSFLGKTLLNFETQACIFNVEDFSVFRRRISNGQCAFATGAPVARFARAKRGC